jgi:hypothetical protein
MPERSAELAATKSAYIRCADGDDQMPAGTESGRNANYEESESVDR